MSEPSERRAVETEMEVTVTVPEGPDEATRVLRIARQAGGSLRAQVVRHLRERTLVSFVCDTPSRAFLELQGRGFRVDFRTVVTAVTEDCPGASSHVVRTVEAEGIRVLASYASVTSSGNFVVLRTDAGPETEDALRRYLHLPVFEDDETPNALAGGTRGSDIASVELRAGQARPPRREDVKITILVAVLVEWMAIAREHGITYWLDWGTLLGCYRAGRIIPWDEDVDVGVPMEEVEKLERLRYETERYVLVVHPQWRRRLEERSYVDGDEPVIFVWPDARLVDKETRRHVDVFSYKAHDEASLIDNTLPEDGGPHVFPRDWIFPLEECTFEGLDAYRPRQSEKVLHEYYGDDLSPDHYWENGRWRRIVNRAEVRRDAGPDSPDARNDAGGRFA